MFKTSMASLALILAAWLWIDYRAVDNSITLTIGGPFEFTSQDLAKDGFIYTRMQVAEALVEVKPNGELTPKLAKQWRTSEDRLTWWFTLRDDVVFHDMQPLNADSVVQSLNHALKKPGVLRQLPLKNISVDNDELRVELDQPFSPILSVLAHFSAAILSPKSYDERGNVTKIYGTGPYQVSRLAPPHKLHVKAFNHYWGDKPAIEQVHYLTGHRAESRALQAKSGQADLIYTLDPASLAMLNNAENLHVYSESIPRTVLIKPNNEHPLLNHKDIRQALSLALDRQGIANHIVRVPHSEAYQLFPPALDKWHLKHIGQQHQNIEQATQLLAKHGWNKGVDGILERDAQRFSLNLVTYADRPELTVIATALQAQLAQVGIEIDISIDNSSAIPARHHNGSLELALIARNFGILSDPLALLIDDHRTHKGRDWGAMNWSSAELNQLLEHMQQQPLSQHQPYATQIATLLADEMPLIPVVFYTQQVAVNQRVANFQFDPFENNYRASEMYFAD